MESVVDTKSWHTDNEQRLRELYKSLPELEFLFIRHANAPAADADVKRDLSDIGKQQCEDAGSNYFGKLENIAFIVHSPVPRCKSTARLVFANQCRSINGNAPVMPIQRLYPDGAKYRFSEPSFAEAVAKTEEAYKQLGVAPLKRYFQDPQIKAAFTVYATHVWHELLDASMLRLQKDQDDRFAAQVTVFGHGVYSQALAYYASEILTQLDPQRDIILNATLDELDLILLQRRFSKFIQPLKL